MRHVVFRCDASPAIGAGHVSRCLALADAFAKAGWSAHFVVGAETPAVVPDLRSRGFPIHVLAVGEDEISAVCDGSAELIVLDHYQRDASFEAACRRDGRRVLAFDDGAHRRHACDVLVDAAGDAAAYRPWVEAHTRILTGPQYAVVATAFQAYRAVALARRDSDVVRSLLVSCGATDPQNVTVTVLAALANMPLSVTVVLSSRAPHLGEIVRRFGARVRIVTDATNMPELISGADIAIGSPGVSAYERAMLGLPSILITVADNQRGIAKRLLDVSAALDAGAPGGGLRARLRGLIERLITDTQLRQSLARAAAAMIDGGGAARIVDAAT